MDKPKRSMFKFIWNEYKTKFPTFGLCALVVCTLATWVNRNDT